MKHEIISFTNWNEIDTQISNLFCWSYSKIVHSILLGEEVSFVLIAENTKEANDIRQFDFDYILQVAEHIDVYIEKAIEGIKKELEHNFAMFGIKQEQTIDYLNIANKDFPVAMPAITIYPNNEMYLQFYEANFPNVEYGLGIGVCFENDKVTSVDILESDEDNMIEQDLM